MYVYYPTILALFANAPVLQSTRIAYSHLYPIRRGATHFNPCSSQPILTYCHTHTNPMCMPNKPSWIARVSTYGSHYLDKKMNAKKTLRSLGT